MKHGFVTVNPYFFVPRLLQDTPRFSGRRTIAKPAHEAQGLSFGMYKSETGTDN